MKMASYAEQKLSYEDILPHLESYQGSSAWNYALLLVRNILQWFPRLLVCCLILFSLQ